MLDLQTPRPGPHPHRQPPRCERPASLSHRLGILFPALPERLPSVLRALGGFNTTRGGLTHG